MRIFMCILYSNCFIALKFVKVSVKLNAFPSVLEQVFRQDAARRRDGAEEDNEEVHETWYFPARSAGLLTN